ncbi:MAG TPA: DUF1343 domain-containing protein, partial [Leptospiraceae bacterium]|nr:DUF1343 domain-containing protein [Leptospiraceae bacterium]
LQLIRWIRSECHEFRWNEGPYEFRSDRPAIELLAGHRVLLSYLNGETDLPHAEAAIQAGEHEWKNRIRSLS